MTPGDGPATADDGRAAADGGRAPRGPHGSVGPEALAWKGFVGGATVFVVEVLVIGIAVVALSGDDVGTAEMLRYYGLEGMPQLVTLIGWVVYNAHLVPVTDGTTSINLVLTPGSGLPVFARLSPLIVAVFVYRSGKWIALQCHPDGAPPAVAARAGAATVAGYLPAVVAGLVVLRRFAVPFDPTATGVGPDPALAVAVAGVVWPVVVGAIGGHRASSGRRAESDDASASAGGGVTTTSGARQPTGAVAVDHGEVHFEERLEPPADRHALLQLVAKTGLVSEDRRTDVRVTDSGVTVERNWSPLMPWTSQKVAIPFATVTAVAYSPAEGKPIHVSQDDLDAYEHRMMAADSFVTFPTEDRKPQRFWVRRRRAGGGVGYRGGVRIGREGASPVYVGSERPRELAAAIAEATPGVSDVAELNGS